jgi:tetratricopeptide (TPR) repeat protein
VVLLFAFLVSSSAVRNSDFWIHLAAGRLLANGEYRFGVDPFSYTSTGAYWVNHAWLFDLGLYTAYQAFGGVGLVVLKALAIAGLAWLMLRVHRSGTGAALPAACTLLALLAMSPRLLLQPACVSLVLLGLSFYLLWRPHAGGPEAPTPADLGGRLRRYGALLVLFALWANVDAWFLLGPLLAALFWLGERMGPVSQRRTPAWLAPAGLAACLLNPHFHRVFALPPELAPALWASELHDDPRFASWFLSPWWHIRDYLEPNVGLSAGGLAYFALVGLGLTSFVLCGRSLLGWRLLIWGAFALLSAWQARAIPFFAVVAGPITALNLQDIVATIGTGAVPHPRERLFDRLAGGALVALGLAAAALAWPGWLQAVPHEQHRVAWEVQPEPSLQLVAETLHRWRQEGLLPEGEHIFPMRPEVAHYCAWFAPGEKGFLDQRSPRFSQLAPQYEAVCRALASTKTRPEGADEWREILRDYGITVVVLYEPNEQWLFAALQRLARAEDEWDLLQIDGRALVFGWKGGGGSFERLRLDPHRLAFGPADVHSPLPPAPDLGPQRPPQRREWWEQFLTPSPAPGWKSDAATMYLRYFEDRAPVEQRQALASHAAGVVASAAPGTPVAAEQVVLGLLEDIPGFGTREAVLPLLTVRAARLAIAANPDDANAWLRLGQAYVWLHRATGERPSSGHSPLLGFLRHVQAVTALEHALLLDPDLEQAHEGLSVLYGERTYLDAALEHRRHALRLTRRGHRVGETEQEFADRLKAEEETLQLLEKRVQDNKNDFAIRSRAMSGDPLGRARLALRLGLARLALDDVLLQSPVQSFAGEGARLELELLLQFGRAEVVRGMLDDSEMRENKDKLGSASVPDPARPGYMLVYRFPAYEWLRFLQAAATGDYGPAAEALEELVQPLAENGQRAMGRMQLVVPVALATELGLYAGPEYIFLRLIIQGERRKVVHHLTEVSFLSAQRADLNILGGLLAMERGAQTDALQYFNAAFAAAEERGPPADFAAAPLADAYRRWLQAFGAGANKK